MSVLTISLEGLLDCIIQLKDLNARLIDVYGVRAAAHCPCCDTDDGEHLEGCDYDSVEMRQAREILKEADEIANSELISSLLAKKGS